MLIITVAMKEEAQPLLSGGGWRAVAATHARALHQAEARGPAGLAPGALLAVSGIGRAAAEATTTELLEWWSPTAVISLGFGGGLAEGPRTGDLVVAERTLGMDRENGGPRLSAVPSDPDLVERATAVLDALGLPHRVGDVLTVEEPVLLPEDKQRLGALTGALAAEMEGFWVGALCREAGVPFLAVRAVLDPVADELPPYVPALAVARGFSRARTLLLRPHRLVRLAGLARCMSLARRPLGRFAPALLADLAGRRDRAARG